MLASNYGLGAYALPIALIPLIKNALYEYNTNHNKYDHEAEMEALYKELIMITFLQAVVGYLLNTQKIVELCHRKCKQADGSWKKNS